MDPFAPKSICKTQIPNFWPQNEQLLTFRPREPPNLPFLAPKRTQKGSFFTLEFQSFGPKRSPVLQTPKFPFFTPKRAPHRPAPPPQTCHFSHQNAPKHGIFRTKTVPLFLPKDREQRWTQNGPFWPQTERRFGCYGIKAQLCTDEPNFAFFTPKIGARQADSGSVSPNPHFFTPKPLSLCLFIGCHRNAAAFYPNPPFFAPKPMVIFEPRSAEMQQRERDPNLAFFTPGFAPLNAVRCSAARPQNGPFSHQNSVLQG